MNVTRKSGIRLAVAFTAMMIFFDYFDEANNIALLAIRNFVSIIIIFEVLTFFESKIRKKKL